MRGARTRILALPLSGVLALLLAGAGSSAGPAAPFTRVANPKLDSQLAQVAQMAAAKGVGAALTQAASADVRTQSRKVRVIVVAKPGATVGAQSALSAVGGTKVASAGSLTSALVPPGSLTKLAASAAVAEVRPPLPHAAEGTDEAISLTDADTWQSAGFTGSGVKIGIIDLGFAGYTTKLSGVGVTLRNHCADINDTPHGTAVAEVAHQMAPDAQLYLYCIDDEVGLAQAESEAIADGVKVINHSVAWFNSSRGDGTGGAGTPDAIAADARAHGILWVNAAGNYGFDHWAGSYTPSSADPDLNDFVPGVDHEDVVMAGNESACAYLKWDAWPVTSEDYDLYLVRTSDGIVVASSASDQADGPISPTEGLCYTNPSGSPTTYSIYISRYSAAGNEQLDLYYTGSDTLPNPITESITEPASSPATLAVGAQCWQTGDLEFFSSRGPTIDGRTKPDLTAPDSVSTATYGDATSGPSGCGASGFAGTSAAAPQVAGAAALLLEQQPSLTIGELTAALEERAQANQSNDLGTPPPDDDIGHGALRLGPFTDSIGTIAYGFNGSTYLTDGEMNQYFLDAADPAWSPDGSRIAVYSGGGIATYDQMGNLDKGPVANTVSGDIQPAWAPDDTTIVFYRTTTNAIEKVNIATSTVTQLATGVTNPDPEWAPDNSKIAFVKSGDIWLMDPNGANQTQLTHLGSVTAPTATGDVLAWSPDSSKIAFVVGSNPFSIWVVNADGSNPHPLASGTSDFSAFAPSWSPDGSQILFTDSGRALELMDADGSNVRPLNPHESMSTARIDLTSWTSAKVTLPDLSPSIVKPNLEGEPLVGSPLQIENTGWVGAIDNVLETRWYRCQPSNLCGTTLPSTDTSDTLTQGDLGFYITAQVTPATHGVSFRAVSSNPSTPILPTAPTVSDLPTFNGTAASGSTLTDGVLGTWTGVPTFDLQWERCATDGSTCRTIGGATDPNYTLTSADVGHTIRLAVFGTNDGGTTVAISAPSATVTGDSGGGGGGGSGGGGGGGGPLDLATSASASVAQVPVGGQVTYRIAITDLTGVPANHLHVTVALPIGATVDSATTDRGSGCTASGTPGQLVCDLDYLAGSPAVGNIVILATLTQAGQATLTAAAQADQTDVNLANNTATVAVQVGTATQPSPPPSPSPPPPPPLPAPKLGKTTTRVLSAIRHTATDTFDGHFTANEAMRVTLTVSKLRSTRRMKLLAGSRLGSAKLRSATTIQRVSITRVGRYAFHIVLDRTAVVKGATYVVHLTARNTRGKTAALTIRFRG